MLKDKELKRLNTELKTLRDQYNNCQYFYSNYKSDGGTSVTKKEQTVLDNLGTLISNAETRLYKKEQELEKYHKASVERVAKANNLNLELEQVVTKGNLESNSLKELKAYKKKANSMIITLSYDRIMTDKESIVFNKINEKIKIINLKIKSILKKENNTKFEEIKSFIQYLDTFFAEIPIKDKPSEDFSHILEKYDQYTKWSKNRNSLSKEQKATLSQLDDKIIATQQEIQAHKILKINTLAKEGANKAAMNIVNDSIEVVHNDIINKEEAKVIYPDSLKKYMKHQLIKMSESTKSAIADVVANIGSQKDEKDMSTYKGSIFYKAIVEGFIGYAGAIVKHPGAKVALALSKVVIMAIQPTFLKNAKSSPPTNLKAFEADWRNVYTDMEREDSVINALNAIWRKNEFKDPKEMEADYKKIIDNLSIDKAAIRKIITIAWIKASKDGIDNELNAEFNSKAGFLNITTHVTFFKNFKTGLPENISWTNTITQLNDVDKIQGVKKSLANLGITSSSGKDENLALSTLDLETCVSVVIGAVIKDNSKYEASNLNSSIMAADIGIKDKKFFLVRRKNGKWETSPKANKMLQPFLESFKTTIYKPLKIKDIAAI